MQNKIDRLILNANGEFSEQRNVVAALVEYSKKSRPIRLTRQKLQSSTA